MQNALVIPCYNFAQGLPSTLRKLEDWRQTRGKDFLICFVDDGSTDDTPQLLKDFAARNPSWCQVEILVSNVGKGAAIRHGFAVMQEKVKNVIFTDCDLHYGLSIITDMFLPALVSQDIVIVDRSYKKQVHFSLVRKFTSGLFNRFITILTGVAYRDTQAGLKGFRVETCRPLFEALTLDGFTFDVEILSLALFYRFHIEVISVNFGDRYKAPDTSTIGIFRSSFSMLFDLFKINLNWKKNVYATPELVSRLEKKVYLIDT